MSGFKIRLQYLYAPLESAKTFPTKEAAEKELKKWKKQHKADPHSHGFKASIIKSKESK